MQVVAEILQQGSIRTQCTSLAVELLWNLLESCPHSDPSPAAGLGATQPVSCPRHSQLANTVLGATKQQLPPIEMVNDGQDNIPAEVPLRELDDVDNAGQGSAECSQAESASAPEPAPGDDSNLGKAESDAASAPGSNDALYTEQADAFASKLLHNGSGDDTMVADSLVQQTEADSLAVATASKSSTGAVSSVGTAAAASADADSHKDHMGAVSISASSTETTVASALVRVLADCLTNGYSTADKELRNTVLIVAQLLDQNSGYRAAL